MVRLSSFAISIFFIITPIFSQFGSIKINFDDRLLRSDEKHDLLNLKEDIRQFYLNTSWDKEYSDLDIPLHIQLIFEGAASKGNVKTYICKALFSNGSELDILTKAFNFIIVRVLVFILTWCYLSLYRHF